MKENNFQGNLRHFGVNGLSRFEGWTESPRQVAAVQRLRFDTLHAQKSCELYQKEFGAESSNREERRD